MTTTADTYLTVQPTAIDGWSKLYDQAGTYLGDLHHAGPRHWWLHLPSDWDGDCPSTRRSHMGGFLFPSKPAALRWIAAQRNWSTLERHCGIRRPSRRP